MATRRTTASALADVEICTRLRASADSIRTRQWKGLDPVIRLADNRRDWLTVLSYAGCSRHLSYVRVEYGDAEDPPCLHLEVSLFEHAAEQTEVCVSLPLDARPGSVTVTAVDEGGECDWNAVISSQRLAHAAARPEGVIHTVAAAEQNRGAATDVERAVAYLVSRIATYTPAFEYAGTVSRWMAVEVCDQHRKPLSRDAIHLQDFLRGVGVLTSPDGALTHRCHVSVDTSQRDLITRMLWADVTRELARHSEWSCCVFSLYSQTYAQAIGLVEF